MLLAQKRAKERKHITPAIATCTETEAALIVQQQMQGISNSKNKEAGINAEASTEQIAVLDKCVQTCKLGPSKSKTPKEKMPPHSLRFDGSQHWISCDDPNESRKGRRCKKEGCGLPTTVYCEKCKVHLCFVTGKNGRNCFKSFHQLNES